ncbi:uncharacterized protein N7525_007938 [Penicillium rubens]|uniref:uncharacterized protein n=1 Tax=Penicillium rubens TaxID=1108849 RepID=UPI002A5A9E68|nr:uncharacterized protein N7525_007938 [Penicillium rubens]KAJ5829685.1 hypothetical protein N7525_007938 [Penicillium rubens]KAJ5853269.1 hypothetical protein N7534_005812 [Penicillium rubens]
MSTAKAVWGNAWPGQVHQQPCKPGQCTGTTRKSKKYEMFKVNREGQIQQAVASNRLSLHSYKPGGASKKR